MDLRSGRRLTRSSPPAPPHATRSHRMDRISALSDDMLLLVLSHLGCVRTAVQSSLLSRRWHRLCSGMTDLKFRGLSPTTIEAVLPCFSASPQVSTLDIVVSSRQTATSINSLLRATVPLSPTNLLFTLQEYPSGYYDGISLPCFQGTTSIEIDTGRLAVKPLPDGEFTALESLSITGQISELRSLLKRCPRLRVLSLSHQDMHLSPTMLPPASEFQVLEKLSLSGKTVDLGPLLSNSKHLQELSVTQEDTCLLRIRLPPSGELPMLEKLSLSGNIADFGTLLSRCPRLRVLGVSFRGMSIDLMEEGLTALENAAPLGLMLSLLGVQIPWRDDIDTARFNSLLRTVARLSPNEFIFTDNYEGVNFSMFDKKVYTDLPCFPRARSLSIAMSLQNVWFTTLPASDFLALKRLCISGHCGIVDISTLVARCPCLQELNVTVPMSKITVHSDSLRKLYLSHNMNDHIECHHVDIVTPMLKKLHLNFHATRDMGVNISAPPVEKVSWRIAYTALLALLFGSWRLEIMSVETMERSSEDNRDDTSWQQPPRFHCLRLVLNAGNHLDGEMNFSKEIEKFPVTNFSVVELYFQYEGHVYGGFVLQLFRLHRIRAAAKKLKVFLPFGNKKKRSCLGNCPCDNPKNWRSQNIFSTSLEELEIYGFNGEDHENDFLRLILTSSPMLKRLTMVLETPFGGCTTTLSSILLAHPSVNWRYHHFNTSEVFSSESC